MMKDIDDNKPFPIQSETVDRLRYSHCTVPFWLAQLAYQEYAKKHRQPLETIGQRGGFGRAELIALIRGGEWLTEGCRKARADLDALQNDEAAF